MHADAYARARKLLGDRRGVLTTIGVLGVLQSLLILGMLAIVGLLTALLTTQGEARFRKDQEPVLVQRAPWVRAQEVGLDQDQDEILFENTGLLPVAAGNITSINPVTGPRLGRFRHAEPGGDAAEQRWCPGDAPGRGLGLLLALCVVVTYRRRLISEAVTGVATTLRSQIHRQMYRLGQSSLPTEGIGRW